MEFQYSVGKVFFYGDKSDEEDDGQWVADRRHPFISRRLIRVFSWA